MENQTSINLLYYLENTRLFTEQNLQRNTYIQMKSHLQLNLENHN